MEEGDGENDTTIKKKERKGDRIKTERKRMYEWKQVKKWKSKQSQEQKGRFKKKRAGK